MNECRVQNGAAYLLGTETHPVRSHTLVTSNACSSSMQLSCEAQMEGNRTSCIFSQFGDIEIVTSVVN